MRTPYYLEGILGGHCPFLNWQKTVVAGNLLWPLWFPFQVNWLPSRGKGVKVKLFHPTPNSSGWFTIVKIFKYKETVQEAHTTKRTIMAKKTNPEGSRKEERGVSHPLQRPGWRIGSLRPPKISIEWESFEFGGGVFFQRTSRSFYRVVGIPTDGIV